MAAVGLPAALLLSTIVCSDEDSSDSGAMIRAQEVEIALRRGEQAENDRAKRARTRAARLAA